MPSKISPNTHGHSENFYRDLLNKIYQWSLINANNFKQNVEAIDLIDSKNKFVLQVSSTATKEKIESSLSKNSIKEYANDGYRFKFVLISKNADTLRKNTFKNLYSIIFEPSEDIIDIGSTLRVINNLEIIPLKEIYTIVKNELGKEPDPKKLESNLAAVINIISKENWDTEEPIDDAISFEIDRKISHNQLDSASIIINDYKSHSNKLDKIYTEFDLGANNKSKSVLSAIRQEYAKIKIELADDKLFFEIIKNVQNKVLDSANYKLIPIDELELCINIIVVDAFMRCKIFEKPPKPIQDNYAIT